MVCNLKNIEKKFLNKMLIIHHRINNIKDLESSDSSDGAEIDVRYHCNDLILHHDPYEHHNSQPTLLESFLKAWKLDGPLILNIKSEGIEDSCIYLMEKYKISNWFFLDISMPFFIKYSFLSASNSLNSFKPQNLAVRYSDYEPIEYAMSFKKSVEWVWVDTFKNFPLTREAYQDLKYSGFKICLVSPELHGHPPDYISEIRSIINDHNMTIDAVCTKFPKAWS